MKFEHGQVVCTNGIANAFYNNFKFFTEVMHSLDRFFAGDWGELCAEDKATNEEALVHGHRLFGKYDTCRGPIYIITEWDRSVTTVLFPDEY